MRSFLALALKCSLGAGIVFSCVTPGVAGASGSVVISSVFVTAAPVGGNSALMMRVANDSNGLIALTSVTTPVSGMSMIYDDKNMLRRNNPMHWLSNIIIKSGHAQELALRNEGVVLSDVRTALVVGEALRLKVTWTDYHRSHSVTVEAKIVSAPKGLHFDMGTMNMNM